MEREVSALGAHLAVAQRADLEHDEVIAAARERFLAHVVAPPRRTTRPWRAAAGLIAAAAVVLALFITLARDRPLAYQVGAEPSRAEAGAWISAPADRELTVRFSDGTTFVLSPSSRLRVVSIGARGARIALERGGIEAAVIHRAGAAWHILAGPADVHVTGTRFRVSWDPASEHFAVTMHEGAVTIFGPPFGLGHPLRTGQSVSMSLLDGRVELTSGSSTVAPPPPSASPAPSLGSASPAPSPPASKWSKLAAAAQYKAALAAAEAEGFAGLCVRSSSQDLLLLGDVARYAGDAKRAVEALSALRRRFPADPRAAVAAFLLGKIAFDMRGDYHGAAEWFATYVRELPGGPLAREAAGRLIEAYDRAGDAANAGKAARAYLKNHPTGPHAELARRLSNTP